MVPKKTNHFNDLSGDVDVRFPEGKHDKHPNIINSMKSRFPKWKGGASVSPGP